MRTSITTTRNVAAARAEVAAAVDRLVERADGSAARTDEWQLAAWTASLRSWRRTGHRRRSRGGLAVTVDLLEIDTAVTQLTVWTDAPRWVGRRAASADLTDLANTIRHAAEEGPSAPPSPAPEVAVPQVPVPALPAVGYSLP